MCSSCKLVHCKNLKSNQTSLRSSDMGIMTYLRCKAWNGKRWPQRGQTDRSPRDPWDGGWGGGREGECTYLSVLGGVCRPSLQILTLFPTRQNSFDTLLQTKLQNVGTLFQTRRNMHNYKEVNKHIVVHVI